MRHFPDGEASGPLEAYVQLLSTLHAATGHEQDLPEVRCRYYGVEPEASPSIVATVQVHWFLDMPETLCTRAARQCACVRYMAEASKHACPTRMNKQP